MQFSWAGRDIIPHRSLHASRGPMKIVATSTLQVACAIWLCGAGAVTAQAGTASSRAVSPPRAALARAVRDSMRRVLQNALTDRAFPGAYAVVGDSHGILAEVA